MLWGGHFRVFTKCSRFTLTAREFPGRFPVMARTRRFAALLGSLFALHLMVVGGLAHEVPGAGASAMAAALESAVSMRLHATSETSAASADEARCPDAEDCPMPQMPGGCTSAAPCPSAVSVPAGPASFAFASPRAVRGAVATVSAPHERLSPPDFPPPRA